MPHSLKQQFLGVYELVKRANNILIASHENPDADAVGSVLALYHEFKKRGLKCTGYVPNRPQGHFSFLPDFFEIKTKEEIFSGTDIFSYDLYFCLDYGDFRRLCLPDSLPSKSIITIDHHIGDQRGGIKIIAPEASSTSEIIYDLFRENNTEIDKDIAVCLLTGIVFDTGLFSHPSTSPKTIKAAADLLSKGISLTKIIRSVLTQNFQPASFLNQAKIWSQALSRVRVDEKTGIAYSWLCQKELEKCQPLPDLAKIPSLISALSPANCALFLVEQEEGKIKGSLRSEPYRGRNVASLAKAMGGGGHPYAAGFRKEGTIKEVLKDVIKLVG